MRDKEHLRIVHGGLPQVRTAIFFYIFFRESVEIFFLKFWLMQRFVHYNNRTLEILPSFHLKLN